MKTPSSEDVADARLVRRYLAKYPGATVDRVIVATGAMPTLLLAMVETRVLSNAAGVLNIRRQKAAVRE